MRLDTEAKKADIKRKATISKTGSAKRVAIEEIENLIEMDKCRLQKVKPKIG